MNGFHLLKTKCPACGHDCNAAGSMTTPAAPQPGDLSVCIRCAAVSQYNSAMGLELVSDDEIGAPEYVDAREIRAKVLELRRMH